MHVGILGPLQVAAGGRAVEIGGARLRGLLVRLAVEAGRPVTVEALARALWPDDMPADPGHALQSLVSRLRRALPAEDVLRSGNGGYCLDLPQDAVDTHRFERLAREGERALIQGQPRAAAERLREALALWRGEALVDAAQAPYATALVARLEELRLTAIEGRLRAELDIGSEISRVVAELEQLAAAHPLRERLRCLLVAALDADGRQAEALAAYEEYRGLLADELGADPGPEMRAVHLSVLRGETVRVRRGNLRVPLTSFIGREEERDLISRGLRDERLVTLVGPGGAGKTRLAATVAAELTDSVPGGVWLVELAAMTDPGGIPQAVADVLRLHEMGATGASAEPRSPVGRLVEALSLRETLIVLDDCEHLIDAVAHLVEELLGRCPGLRALVTSREPLEILGETVYEVPPLPVPAPGAPATDTMACEAVRLFADRAAAVRAGFAVTDENLAAVAEICRRLDGLPLAIELAAARLRTMPLEHLAAGIDDRFRVLTGSSRTALPRHRTLRAVVGWSWDLLAPEERAAAERLAVFPAPFTPDSAEQLGVSQDVLHALVAKSLVQLVSGHEVRYRMLETIREYGLERLAAAGELARARAAHAAHFLELAECAVPQLRGPGQLPWLRTLEAERDHLFAALTFACETGDSDTAVRLGAALGYAWAMYGDHADAANRLRAPLAMGGPAPVEARLGLAACCLLNAVLAGDLTDAKAAVEPLRGLADAHAELPEAALVQALLALVAGDTAEGVVVVDARLPRYDPWFRGLLWLIRSFLHGNDGDMPAMRQDLTAAAAAFREAGERWGLATTLTYLAFVQNTLGRFDDAVATLEESGGLLHELGTGHAQRVWLAMIRIHTGDVDRARVELLDILAAPASAAQVAWARLLLADLARYSGDAEEASRQLDGATRDVGSGAGDDAPFRALFHTTAGYLAAETGDLDGAEQHLSRALALAVGMPDMPMAAVVGVGAARLRLSRDAPAAAAEVLGAAHSLRGGPDARHPDVVRLTHELNGRLGERAYRSAYDRGRALARADALTLIETQTRRR